VEVATPTNRAAPDRRSALSQLGGPVTARPVRQCRDAPTNSIGASASPAKPDAVASELDQINQLINDIDNSVQNSDSSSQGGE
jgi:hypothetical protein